MTQAITGAVRHLRALRLAHRIRIEQIDAAIAALEVAVAPIDTGEAEALAASRTVVVIDGQRERTVGRP